MTKSKKIRDYKQANPNAKPKDIAKACGVKTTYVYQVLHNAKKKPAKGANLVVENKPTQGQQVLRDEIERLNAEIANLQILDEINDEIIAGHVAEIDQLKQDVIGYRAVISYLQAQIDGVAV